MKFKTPFSLACISLLFAYTSFSAIAATDSTEINISHTYTPYVNFTGTAPGASRFYDNSDVIFLIFPVSTNLGTMGLESNVGGTCSLDFTTQNNFELLHTVNNSSFGDYNIQFRGETFGQGSNPQLNMPCTSNATDLNFIMNGLSLGGINFFINAGTYQDIVSVVVTTQ